MSNVIQFPKKESLPKQKPPYVSPRENITRPALKGSKAPKTYQERVDRIKESLKKINSLMEDLKTIALGDRKCPPK